ncbi:metallophosphoesterase [Pedobacter sp. SYSU D00535]|uniref:BamA/TamA family outer membrane protein n=1 Tax=Pedobacter sp. SYSU D00535 TaxID=2810308 RepID=UPI001A961165|nr:metallophosphoesterase [Pedobacter sp. SYSU D00535]
MKINFPKSSFYIIFSLVIITGCISRKPFYDKSQVNWQEATPPDSTKLKYTVFVIGDAGRPDDDVQEPTLKLLQKQLFDSTRIVKGDTSRNISRPEDVVLFVGDNIYETGLPEPDAPDRKEKERRIIAQMDVVKEFRGRKIFIPGNHDWNESRPGGLAAVQRQEAFVEAYLDSNDVFMPSNGCPGPVEVQMNNDLVLVILDTEWWLHKHRKPIAPDNGCTAANRVEILEQVEDILVRNRGKNIVIAQHHPLFSNGKHNGYFTLKDYFFPLTLVRPNLYIPLPVIGSIYPFMRQYGISRQDLSNKDYQQLKRGLLAILADEPNVVIAAGHEHALQFNKFDNINHVLSGAGAKENPVAKGNEAMFAYGEKGFARINYYDNGQAWVEYWIPVEDGSTGKLVYRTPMYAIPPKKRVESLAEQRINYSDSVKVIAAGPQYKASEYKKRLYGEHYRETWATPVKVPYLDLTTFAGGLTPLKMGGGKQTTSLQLEGKDGNVYQFRTISKDPSALLPEGFLRTFADDLFQDQISSAHPYGGLIIPQMAKAIGIFYVTPKLVYMPYSRLLGPYLQQVGGQLGTIEARPDEDVSDFKSFGNAKNAVSTRKLYEELLEDNDNEVDQQMFLKARLFDMIIGDWDRHEDQWRWAEFKKEKGSIYRPIPRDRDQAFTKYDGIVPSLVSKIVPDIQHFGTEIKDPAKLSLAARNLDRNLLNKLTRDQWVQLATEVQNKLTDAVIEEAVRQMPEEVFAKSGQEIIDKLKSRRNQIVDVATEYYQVLSKEVTVASSEKKEFISVNTTADSVTVTIRKISNDNDIKKVLYQRTFSNKETDEVNLFALEGQDSILIEGDASPIKVRVIGGEGPDFIADRSEAASGKPIKYFDSDTGNTINKGHNTRLRLSAHESVHEFNVNHFNYDKSNVFPALDYNPDDGVFFGAGYKYRHYGFRKKPYSFDQTISGIYAPKTEAYSVRYRSNYYSLFKRNHDFRFDVAYNGPLYTFNYYGEGNSTPNIGDDINYYRVKSKNLSINAFYQRRFTEAFSIGIGPGYEHYWVEKKPNRFLTSPEFPDKPDIDNPSRFAVLKSYANIDYVNSPLFPTTGVRWFNQANYYSEMGGLGDNFLRLQSDVSFYITPNFNFPVTAALRLGGATNIGDYKFFQANFLGSNTNLRGYRNNRFAGRSYVYNNSELRFKVSNFRNYIFTGNLGLFGFFDAGRVYSSAAENNIWHTGYGPGVWLNLYNKFLFSVGYGISKEGNYFSINTGFAF